MLDGAAGVGVYYLALTDCEFAAEALRWFALISGKVTERSETFEDLSYEH